jgi:hypothetical protein
MVDQELQQASLVHLLLMLAVAAQELIKVELLALDKMAAQMERQTTQRRQMQLQTQAQAVAVVVINHQAATVVMVVQE